MYVVNIPAQDADSKYAENLLKAGEAAPNFVLNGSDGASVSLEAYRGSYVVLDFWASWCPDCRRDIPAVKEMYDTYYNKGVAFVSVSFDTDSAAWKKCLNDYGMKWTQVSELKKWKETQVSKDFHIEWIPTMYLIDPEGKVVLGTVMTTKMKSVLERLDSQDRFIKK